MSVISFVAGNVSVLIIPDYKVRDPRLKSHHGVVFSMTTTAIYSLRHGLCTVTAVLGPLSLPSFVVQ